MHRGTADEYITKSDSKEKKLNQQELVETVEAENPPKIN